MASQSGSNSIASASFLGQTIWSTLFWLFLQILMVMVLFPSSWLYEVVRIEDNWMSEQIGEDTSEYIQETASTWYNEAFVYTGINDHVRLYFFPTEEQRLRSTGLEQLGQKTLFPWLEGRVEVLTVLIIKMFERVAHILVWLPYSMILIIPAMFDGVMTWNIKQHSFAYASPFWHRFSVQTAVLMFMILSIALMAPIPIPPFILPLAICFVLPVLVIAFISNMPKRF